MRRLSLSWRLVLWTGVLVISLTSVLTYISWRRAYQDLEERLGLVLKHIAINASLQIDAKEHANITESKAAESVEFRKIHALMVKVMTANYLTPETFYTFNIDSENKPRFAVMLHENEFIGHRYEIPAINQSRFERVMRGESVFTGVYGDSHGLWISGLAPIMDAGKVTGIVEADYRIEKFLSELRIQTMQTIFVSLSILLIAIFLIFVLSRRFMRPIKRVAETIEKLAAGSLDCAMEINGGDEIASIMVSLNNMITHLKSVLMQVHRSASDICLAATQISSTAEMLNTGAMSQAAHVEETTAALREVANLTEKNAIGAANTDHAASESVLITENGARKIEAAVETMRQISQRVEIVQELASQTNLLALNATIEAARAGEHGRGFAVVAAEVGKLADLSGRAAKEIKILIKESSAVSEEAAASLGKIIACMQLTAQNVSAIKESSAEQNNSVQQISQGMRRLSQTTEQTASAAEELAATADQMNSQTSALLEELRFFKIAEKTETNSSDYVPITVTKNFIQALNIHNKSEFQTDAESRQAVVSLSLRDYEKY